MECSTYFLTPEKIANIDRAKQRNIGQHLKAFEYLKFDHDTRQPYLEIPLHSILKPMCVKDIYVSVIGLRAKHVTFTLESTHGIKLWSGMFNSDMWHNDQIDSRIMSMALLPINRITKSLILRIDNIWEYMPHIDAIGV
jgi:hypothetical protein